MHRHSYNYMLAKLLNTNYNVSCAMLNSKYSQMRGQEYSLISKASVDEHGVNNSWLYIHWTLHTGHSQVTYSKKCNVRCFKQRAMLAKINPSQMIFMVMNSDNNAPANSLVGNNGLIWSSLTIRFQKNQALYTHCYIYALSPPEYHYRIYLQFLHVFVHRKMVYASPNNFVGQTWGKILTKYVFKTHSH